MSILPYLGDLIVKYLVKPRPTRMKTVIALGNPEKKYEKTRHNLGWLALDQFIGEAKWEKHHKAKALTTKVDGVLFVKPLTYMNESGRAVNDIVKFYKLSTKDLLIIHDDVDLRFGKMRIVKDVRSGGHRGVQSIINQLGTQDFVRLRLGTANDKLKKWSTEHFVLEPFSFFEKRKLNKWLPTITEAISCLLEHDDPTSCMNRFN